MIRLRYDTIRYDTTPLLTIPTSGTVKMIGYSMIVYGAVRTKYIIWRIHWKQQHRHQRHRHGREERYKMTRYGMICYEQNTSFDGSTGWNGTPINDTNFFNDPFAADDDSIGTAPLNLNKISSSCSPRTNGRVRLPSFFQHDDVFSFLLFIVWRILCIWIRFWFRCSIGMNNAFLISVRYE